MNQMTRHLRLVFACVLGLVPRVVVAGDESLPIGFRFVGNYQLEKRVKIRDAKPFVVRSKPFVCRVYTDGIKVRVYGESGVESEEWRVESEERGVKSAVESGERRVESGE